MPQSTMPAPRTTAHRAHHPRGHGRPVTAASATVMVMPAVGMSLVTRVTSDCWVGVGFNAKSATRKAAYAAAPAASASMSVRQRPISGQIARHAGT